MPLLQWARVVGGVAVKGGDVAVERSWLLFSWLQYSAMESSRIGVGTCLAKTPRIKSYDPPLQPSTFIQQPPLSTTFRIFIRANKQMNFTSSFKT